MFAYLKKQNGKIFCMVKKEINATNCDKLIRLQKMCLNEMMNKQVKE